MIESASLFRAASNQIDELDAEIARLNEDKKAVYENLKETVAPADFRAWRDAVKIRRKTAADREKANEHDARVFAILHAIETFGTPVATRAGAPAGAREGEPSPDAGLNPASEGADAGEEGFAAASPSSPDVSHDPETGEITEQPLTEASLPSSSVEEGGGAFGFSSASDHLPDLPDFLRRAQKAQAVITVPSTD